MHDLMFSVENIDQVEADIQPLLVKNWETVAKYMPQSTFAPNIQVYRDLAAVDRLWIFTVRHEGALVGYALVFLAKHPHRSMELMSVIDAFFVLDEFRKHGAALSFLHYVEEGLAAAGVNVVCFGTRDPLIARWMRSIAKYEPTEAMFERRL